MKIKLVNYRDNRGVQTTVISPKQIEEVEAKCRCNKNHSGNTRLTFSTGGFQCAGCGDFYTVAEALVALSGNAVSRTGSGGLVRNK